MQALSRMQRNLAYQNRPLIFLLVGAALLYPLMGNLYPFFPPFLGTVYLLWRRALVGGAYWTALLWTLYGLVFSAVWGVPLYGVLASMYMMYRFVEPRLRHTLFGSGMVEGMTVVLFNLLYLGLLFLSQAVFGSDSLVWHPIFFYYLLMDLVGAVLV